MPRRRILAAGLGAGLVTLVGCRTSERASVPPPAIYIEDAKVDPGVSLRVHAPAGSSLVVAPEGPVAKLVDDTTWEIEAEDGSYVVAVVPTEGAATKLYVDVGVTGPTGGEMDGLAALPPPAAPIWPYVILGVTTSVTAVWLARYAYRQMRRPAPAPTPDPPHVIALRAWASLRDRTDLEAESVARLMSEIFRAWLDATQQFPATKRTTRETLDNLAGTLTAAELQSARRLLSATDLVKFAERTERANLFEQLDGDFVALVRAGRGVHA